MSAQGQHFLSQCYLKGFTPLGTKESRLVTLNLREQKILPPTIPKNFGKQRYFNRIEIDGLSPDYLEDQLALFEDIADKALRNIERTGRFEGEDRVIILNLIALFVVRNPYRREYWNDMQNYIAKIVLDAATSNVGGTTNGISLTPEFKKLVDEQEFNVDLHQNEHIKLELSSLDTVIRLLAQRKWTLVHAREDLTFITCDRPITLLWKDNKEYVASPGFGSRASQVCFPLTKKLMVVGDFEGGDNIIIASERLMASINSSTISNAALWVYTETGDFVFLKHTGELAYGIKAFWEYFASHVA